MHFKWLAQLQEHLVINYEDLVVKEQQNLAKTIINALTHTGRQRDSHPEGKHETKNFWYTVYYLSLSNMEVDSSWNSFSSPFSRTGQ